MRGVSVPTQAEFDALVALVDECIRRLDVLTGDILSLKATDASHAIDLTVLTNLQSALRGELTDLTDHAGALTLRTAALEGRVTALEQAHEPPPPTPVDCVLGPWTLDQSDAGPWGPCQPDNTQIRTELWRRQILVQPENGGTPCGPLEEIRTGVQACVYVPPDPIPEPGLLFDFPLSSQAELDTYKTGAAWAPVGSVLYDPAMDACQQWINPAVTGKNTPQQKHLPLVIPPGTTFLQTWESYHEPGFAWVNDGYFRTYKSYRWDAPDGTFGPDGRRAVIWLAIKHYFKEGTEHGALARVGVSAQNDVYVLPPTTYTSETPGPQTPFWVSADRWVTTGVYYNATDQQLSVWMGDPVQGFVCLLDRIAYGFPSTGINVFRLEDDTSQNQFVSGNPLSRHWNRRLRVWSGLSYGEAARTVMGA